VKIRIVAVGKIRERYLAEATADFRARLGHYYKYDEVEVAAAHGSDPARAVAEESGRIAAALEPGDVVWLLERAGTELSSEDLAGKITMLADRGTRRLVLVVGGPYGVTDDVRRRAAFCWSLSQLTFLHEWARALVLEQLYRAAKIARNESYHH
jgi:23S rRNA (pseudouridine1915-N3)-methyltransferase